MEIRPYSDYLETELLPLYKAVRVGATLAVARRFGPNRTAEGGTFS